LSQLPDAVPLDVVLLDVVVPLWETLKKEGKKSKKQQKISNGSVLAAYPS
jgi:hypothetical protein